MEEASLRLVALVTNIPGPLAAAALARDGAAVVKIEPPQGDALEPAAPAWYAAITRGMQVLRLDLKAPAARDRLEHLLDGADLLFTSMRVSALERLGLQWPELHVRYPRLCHIAVVGESDGRGDRAGHDLTYQAQAGLVQPPAMPRSVFADLFAAERAAAAAYRALYERERGGGGTYSEISIAQGAEQLADPIRYGLTSAGGPLGGRYSIYGLYATRDGWIALAALEPHFRERLQAALQIESLEAAALSERFAEQPCAYWEDVARRHDLPLCAVVNL